MFHRKSMTVITRDLCESSSSLTTSGNYSNKDYNDEELSVERSISLVLSTDNTSSQESNGSSSPQIHSLGSLDPVRTNSIVAASANTMRSSYDQENSNIRATTCISSSIITLDNQILDCIFCYLVPIQDLIPLSGKW